MAKRIFCYSAYPSRFTAIKASSSSSVISLLFSTPIDSALGGRDGSVLRGHLSPYHKTHPANTWTLTAHVNRPSRTKIRSSHPKYAASKVPSPMPPPAFSATQLGTPTHHARPLLNILEIHTATPPSHPGSSVAPSSFHTYQVACGRVKPPRSPQRPRRDPSVQASKGTSSVPHAPLSDMNHVHSAGWPRRNHDTNLNLTRTNYLLQYPSGTLYRENGYTNRNVTNCATTRT